MKGLGTDDATLISILTGRKRKHLQTVKGVFEKKFGKTLENWIKGETS
jgi:annexin A7/11